MTSRRDRAVSLATVLFALAGGVALGGGPLQGEDDTTSARAGDDASATGASPVSSFAGAMPVMTTATST